MEARLRRVGGEGVIIGNAMVRQQLGGPIFFQRMAPVQTAREIHKVHEECPVCHA